MTEVEELGEVIGATVQETEAPGTQPGTLYKYFTFGTYGIKLRTTRVKVEDRTIGTAFILGHSSNGVLGTSTLGTGTQGSYTEIETLYDTQALTNSGRNYIRDMLNKEKPDYAANPNYLAVGSNSTAFKVDNKILADEFFKTDQVTYNIATSKLATFTSILFSTDIEYLKDPNLTAHYRFEENT